MIETVLLKGRDRETRKAQLPPRNPINEDKLTHKLFKYIFSRVKIGNQPHF